MNYVIEAYPNYFLFSFWSGASIRVIERGGQDNHIEKPITRE